jgi:2-polyprenyl-3-methyl-5-hydroxy-6-metoxy-1,4-benzoquinol methylase
MQEPYNDLRTQYESKAETYFELDRTEMAEFVPKNAKAVLDIGCSGGAFGELLKSLDPERIVWGVEPDAKSAALAGNRLDRAIAGTFSSDLGDLVGRQFDAICFNDVLEHVVNPEQALIDAKEFLNPDGVVVASIPNILFFYQILEILKEQDWRYRDSGILDNTHLRFFTKKSIIRMFENCGYEVTKVQGINASYGLKYKLINLLMLGYIEDWKFVQFAIQARQKTQS